MSASAEVAGMVLRCARTGKLFFSEKDAKQHNEDTGFAEFEQVALEDKVWICSETGKVCVTETELELYKKRDPTAQTFEEKTVAYLREKHLESNRKPAAAVEGGSGDPMDVDATGSPAAEPQPVHIAEETVAQLKEMGFTRVRIERALVNTENGSLETAVNWLAEHGDDEDVDTPVGVPVLVVPQSEIDAHKAKTNLTQEEKQARLQAAVEAAQRKREEAEKADEKERERRRREDGKQMTKTKAELEELQRKRDLEARRKEKLEDQRHRAFLREQLERDKAERRAAREAKGLPAETPATKATQEPAAPEQPSPALANAAPPRPAEPVAVPVVPISEAITAVADNRDFLLETFVETTEKLADNVLKNPTEPKYRHIRTSNPKIHERLLRPTAGELFLVAVGWRRDGDGLSLPMEVAGNVFADAVRELKRVAAERKVDRDRAEREKLRAEREAALKAKAAERERLRQAMQADRQEVVARGPAETIKAAPLPSNQGVNRLNLEEDPRDQQPGPE